MERPFGKWVQLHFLEHNELLGVSHCPKVTVASVQAVRRLEHLRTCHTHMSYA